MNASHIDSPSADGGFCRCVQVMVAVTLGPCSVMLPMSPKLSANAGEGSEPVLRGAYSGRAISAGHDGVWIELDGGDAISIHGARVILDGPWPSRVLGIVVEQYGSRIRVHVRREVEKDRRTAPRCTGALDVLYRKASGDSWFFTGAAPADGWFRPDPLMNFSATGLRFDDYPHVVPGDKVWIELALPKSLDRYRATATVVRVELIPESQRISDATHSVAVHFDQIGSGARSALVARALEISRRRHR